MTVRYLVADNNRGGADDLLLVDIATRKVTSDVEGTAAVYVARLPEGR